MKENQSKWRVALITPPFKTVGGVERYCFETCRQLVKNTSFELTVICEEVIDSIPGIKFIVVGKKDFPRILKKTRFAKRVQKILEQEKFDLVHSHQPVPGAHLYSLHGPPHQVWAKEVQKKRYISGYNRRLIALEEASLQHANCKGVLPVSSLVLEAYLKTYGLHHLSKITVVSPGIHLDESSSTAKNKISKRKSLGFSEQDFIIIFVAMNWAHKGLDFLIESLGKLNKGDKVKLLVVGSGKPFLYSQKAQRNNVDIVFAGTVHENMQDLYGACDLLALPSKWDAFGMVVTEAMVAGLPVVISDQVGAKDLIKDGENGYVLELNNHKLWAETIGQFIQEPSRCISMGKFARNSVESMIWESQAHQITVVYKEILNNNN